MYYDLIQYTGRLPINYDYQRPSPGPGSSSCTARLRSKAHLREISRSHVGDETCSARQAIRGLRCTHTCNRTERTNVFAAKEAHDATDHARRGTGEGKSVAATHERGACHVHRIHGKTKHGTAHTIAR